jgi:mycothiol synthase
MTITACSYTEADRGRLRDLMLAMRREGARGCWHVGDLAWTVFFLGAIDDDPGTNLRLWQAADQRLLGFAWFDPRESFVLLQAQPGPDKWAIVGQMLAWADARRSGDAPPLRVNAFADDPEQMAFLEARGFGRQPGYVHFTRPLVSPLPATVPAGFTVRPVAGEAEIAQRAAAHREAFHPSRVTEAQYRRLTQLPGYCPELDVVAVAADGQVAAFCLCWLDPVNKVGEFEPVGTRPGFQRQGLGRAVLFEGLRRMQARGMETAFVCTQHDNAAAQALYRSVGFDLTNTDFDYVKQEGQ